MKILNLYAGIGGNRKLWEGHEITAVELNPDIAKIYQDFFPDDTVIVGDAHQYLLDNYKEFDFIWSSPPCPSHSRVRTMGVYNGNTEAIYPEMSLYQEIIFLQYFAKGQWLVENVRPYYPPLIQPSAELHRHIFWSNFPIAHTEISDDRVHTEVKGDSIVYGFDLKGYNIKGKDRLLKNMVKPSVGAYILNSAAKYFKPIQEGLFS